MRLVAVVALSVLTLAGGLAEAEARGFRLRGVSYEVPKGARGAKPHSATARGAGGVTTVGAIGLDDPVRADARSVMTTQAHAADEAVPIPPMPPAPILVKKPDEPWCRSGRIAGSGSGFCLLN